ncbi:hypothetical protein AMATHDRAFT_58502 [Amanita thiersii Skay4041]|uniref:Uncharacterized protein n=1 Tax=Amanita thiersii Skay4041 TaxID=703135 RepID=A0A2A9NQV7_9AGAR|nr:hypothetical protein AMATHDRAFT_58502 [Amanita thiersii Skay4041]
MSSAAAARSVAKTAILAPIPPASPFAELLRRSRFASYDPAIRQAYSAPSSQVHRGDWGLKRPISLRRRNAFITLPNFESPAQFTEWNHAENQVRFIRRVEEMNITPEAAPMSSWYRGLGRSSVEWLIDSDFCPEESHIFLLPKKTASASEDIPVSANLEGYGKKGPGQYGAYRPLPPTHNAATHVVPNIGAMSRKDFESYLRKLRRLRPEFKQFLQSKSHFASQSMYELAQNASSDQHNMFILDRTSKEFKDPANRKIEQQRHRSGGLLYSHPSKLDTLLTTEPKPGILLHPTDTNTPYKKFKYQKQSVVVSFSGIAAVVESNQTGGKKPLYDLHSEEGIDRANLEESVGDVRIKRLRLVRPPRVVGRRGEGLKAVKVMADVTVDSSQFEFGLENPYEPGSAEYIAATSTKRRPSDFTYRSQPALNMPMLEWSRVGYSRNDGNDRLYTQLSGMAGNVAKKPKGTKTPDAFRSE